MLSIGKLAHGQEAYYVSTVPEGGPPDRGAVDLGAVGAEGRRVRSDVLRQASD